MLNLVGVLLALVVLAPPVAAEAQPAAKKPPITGTAASFSGVQLSPGPQGSSDSDRNGLLLSRRPKPPP
jgi:hypothetical protein